MIKLAKIVQIDSGQAILRLEKKIQCTDCKSRCSDGFLSFLFGKNNQGTLLVALNQKNIPSSHLYDEKQFFHSSHKQDDIIGLNFNESEIFKMAFILYGLPILIFVLMLLLGYYVFQVFHLNVDLGGIIGLILGLYVSKIIIRIFHKTLKPKVSFFK